MTSAPIIARRGPADEELFASEVDETEAGDFFTGASFEPEGVGEYSIGRDDGGRPENGGASHGYADGGSSIVGVGAGRSRRNDASTDTGGVLDGDLDAFMAAALAQRVGAEHETE